VKKYNFNYNYVAQKLVEIIKVNESGSISYSEVFLKRDIDSILETSYEFSDDTPMYEYHNIVRLGIKKFVKNKIRNGDTLRKSIREAEQEFRLKQFENYILITSFSFQYFQELKGLRFGDTLVKFYKTIPSKYNSNKIKTLVRGYFSEAHPSNYTIVECHIRARSQLEAIDKTFEIVDFIRGLWNYSNNLRVANRI